MAYYQGTADTPDRAKAIAAVAVVHAALAAVILSGLNVRTVGHAVETMTTIAIREPPPPPPPEPPPPAQLAERAKQEEGAAGKKAEPTPIVAPKPRLPVQSPVAAAPIAGTGSAPRAGAAPAGTGTGAGGSGTGRGGGGSGDFSGYTPARRISRIPNREYRRLVAVSGRSMGTVGITLKVNTDGSPSNCRIARSSGLGSVDSLMCQLALQYVRFRPATDASGRPVAQDITWYPDWAPN
jgi:protein TonB